MSCIDPKDIPHGEQGETVAMINVLPMNELITIVNPTLRTLIVMMKHDGIGQIPALALDEKEVVKLITHLQQALQSLRLLPLAPPPPSSSSSSSSPDTKG